MTQRCQSCSHAISSNTYHTSTDDTWELQSVKLHDTKIFRNKFTGHTRLVGPNVCHFSLKLSYYADTLILSCIMSV